MNDVILLTFHRLIESSWQAAVIVVLLAIIMALIGRRIPARWRATLWLLVFIRLAMPALPASRASLFNFSHLFHARVAAAPVAESTVVFGVFPPASLQRINAASVIPQMKQARARINWMMILVCFWLMGIGLLLARRLIATLLFRGRLNRERARSTGRCSLGGLDVIETSLVKTPALWGMFSPVILMPRGFSERLAAEQIDFVLRHEAAHRRRGDLPVFALVDLMTIIHWFNPFAWMARRWFRSECELACDEVVLASAGAPVAAAYGETILRVLELFPSARINGGLQMIGARQTLRRRLRAIQHRPRRWPMLGPALLALLIATTLTAAQSAMVTSSDNAVTREYDVRDLLIEIPNFPSPHLNSAGPDEARPSTSDTTAAVPTHAQRMRILITSITSSIDPLSWRDNTGDLGSIRGSDGRLIITQTIANQEAIQRKLQSMRAGRSIQITVEARFLRSGDARRFLERANHRWIPIDSNGAKLWPKFLDGLETSALIAAANADKSSTIITAPRITLFNGQRAYVMVTKANAYVSDITPVAANGAVAFNPTISLINSGILFDCQAQASDDLHLATLTVRPELSALIEFSTKPASSAQARQTKAVVQVPCVEETRLDATITMPDDRTAVYLLQPKLQPKLTHATTRPTSDEPVLMLLHPIVIDERSNKVKPAATARSLKTPA